MNRIGKIINTNFVLIFIKGAVTSMTKALAVDEAKCGVRVNR